MSTSTRKSSQSNTNTNTNTNTEEKTMTTTTNNTQNTDNKFFNIIVASGRKIAVPEETAYLILSVAKTALSEYQRKASETTIGKINPKPKDPNSIKYDQNMLFRMEVMSAFINKVLEGVTLPEKDNTAILDQLNSL